VANIVDRRRLFSRDAVGVLLVCHRGSWVVGRYHAMDYRQRLGGTDWGRIWSRCRQKLEPIASSKLTRSGGRETIPESGKGDPESRIDRDAPRIAPHDHSRNHARRRDGSARMQKRSAAMLRH
jgi:hypothetical protein